MTKFLSVCAIIKQEHLYLEEFLEFHLLQGVEKFQLYDNDPEGHTEILLPYMRAGLVRLHLWPHNPPQFTAYNNCLKYMAEFPEDDSEWVAFLDCDEFLWAPKLAEEFGKYSTLAFELHRLETVYNHPSAIAVHWMLFGPNGKEKKEDGLVIERFTRRAEAVNHHVKSIVRRKDTVSVGRNPHTFRVARSRIIDEQGDTLGNEYAIHEKGTADILRINHYHTKSIEEYFKRKLENPDPGSGKFPTLDRIEEMLRAHKCDDVEDTSLVQFAETIKYNIENRFK